MQKLQALLFSPAEPRDDAVLAPEAAPLVQVCHSQLPHHIFLTMICACSCLYAFLDHSNINMGILYSVISIVCSTICIFSQALEYFPPQLKLPGIAE